MRLVLFDFDGTLTRRDTLLPFLHHSCGNMRFALGMVALSPILLAYALKLLRNDRAKELVLRYFLRGRRIAELESSGIAFAAQRLPSLLRPEMMALLARHSERGEICVLVSASLDVYLEPWAAVHGFSAVLCSSLDTTLEGSISGRLAGGNCFGPVKVQRVLDWLDGRQPEHITAYGDTRGDLELLAFADSAFWAGASRPPRVGAPHIRPVAAIKTVEGSLDGAA